MKNILKTSNIITLIFLFVIISFFALNFKSLREIIYAKEITVENAKQEFEGINLQYQKSLKGRNTLIDFYGLSLNLMNKSVVGNFEFVRDKNGYMQRFESKTEFAFIDGVAELNDYSAAPLVFVNLPLRSSDTLLLSTNFSFYNAYNITSLLNEKEINFINVPLLDNGIFWLKTDVHETTEAEFQMAKIIAEYFLENNIKLYDVDKVFDITNYEIVSKPFYGNLSRSSGRYFTEVDIFDFYLPQFDTNLTLNSPSKDVYKEGAYTEVLMNGYLENEDTNEFTYWVTNYGNFTHPYHFIRNNNSPVDTNILVIMDSQFMRGVTFLSLVCGNITVYDPRFDDDNSFYNMLISTYDYDAIVVVGGASLFNCNMKIASISDVPISPLPVKDYWIGNGGMVIDSVNGTKLENAELLQFTSGENVTIKGWAVDFGTEKKLSAMYAKIGDKIINCRYNLPQPGPAAHFENPEFIDPGFSVTIPWNLIEDDDFGVVEFILIGTDGSYQYESIRYEYEITPP